MTSIRWRAASATIYARYAAASCYAGDGSVGGPMSAFHPHGAYIDPPLHYECMQFALQTCPYLINQKYQKRIDGATLDPSKATGVLQLIDPTMDPTRPKIFVAVMAVAQTVVENGYVVPKHPFRGLEFWRDGVMEQDVRPLADARGDEAGVRQVQAGVPGTA